VAAFNLFGTVERVAASDPLPAGRHRLGVDVRSGGRRCELKVTIDGAAVAEGRLGRSLPFRWQIGGGGLLVGRDAGFPVCDDYRPPFPFTGTLHEVTIELPGLAPRDPASEVSQALHRE
jgi:arylsulfatase